MVLAIKLLTAKLIARRCAVLFYRGNDTSSTRLESITYKEGHQRRHNIRIPLDLTIIESNSTDPYHSPFLDVGAGFLLGTKYHVSFKFYYNHVPGAFAFCSLSNNVYPYYLGGDHI